MFLKVRLSVFCIYTFSSIALSQQVNTSIVFDNYVSSDIATFNPSSIVDSKSKLAFTSNFNLNRISNFYAKDYAIYDISFFGGKLKKFGRTGYQKSDQTIDILNIKYELDHQNALSYAFRLRFFSNTLGIPSIWAKNALSKYTDNITNQSADLTGMSMSRLILSEHVFTYARTIFDKGETFLKAGASIKFLNGLTGQYFSFNNGSIEFIDPQNDFAKVSNVDATFGVYANDAPLKYRNRGIGLDLGATYEIRPDHKQQFYDMDGEENLVKYDMNKYKWKFGISITDIGSVKFMKDSNYYDFSNLGNNLISSSSLYDIEPDFGLPINSIKDYLQTGGTKNASQASKFRMNLPTTLHANADFHYRNNIYVSYNFSLPLSGPRDVSKVTNTFIHTITPRYETELFSVLLPLSQMGNGRCYIGLAGRFTIKGYSVWMGANNMMFMLGQKSSLTRNFFLGATYNILHKTPADKDKDKVSDLRDVCPSDPGLFSLGGCPDTDGDGIPDREDYCIYDQGPIATRGCPDTDGDGIIDMNDRCPDVKGLGVHLGCPDRDYDGVIDVADKCPDEPGIELNNGCPFENPGCCMDNDGDGVSNNVDKCPDHAGSVYNDGCPIDKDNLNHIKLNSQKEKLDPNHTESQIKVLSNNDTIRNLISSKAELDKIIENKTVIKETNVYFDHDQSNINESEQRKFDNFVKEFKEKKTLSIVVVGRTDRDGSLDYNLILSKKRAETVKRKLVDAGFDEEKISVYYYGEAKTLYKGSYTEEQKRLERKVQIKIIQDK